MLTLEQLNRTSPRLPDVQDFKPGAVITMPVDTPDAEFDYVKFACMLASDGTKRWRCCDSVII